MFEIERDVLSHDFSWDNSARMENQDMLVVNGRNSLCSFSWENESKLSRNSQSISIHVKGGAHEMEISTDEGNLGGQCNYGLWLLSGKNVSTHLRSATHYFAFSTDEGNGVAQNHYGFCLQNGEGVSIDHENPNTLDHSRMCCFAVAVQNREISSDGSTAGAVYYGWCLYARKVVPVDFTVAAEFFKSLPIRTMRTGQMTSVVVLSGGVDEDIECAVVNYRKAVAQSHPHA
jgi:hypothetical protein